MILIGYWKPIPNFDRYHYVEEKKTDTISIEFSKFKELNLQKCTIESFESYVRDVIGKTDDLSQIKLLIDSDFEQDNSKDDNFKMAIRDYVSKEVKNTNVEFDIEDLLWINPEELTSFSYDRDCKNKIIDHLKKGRRLNFSMGNSYCRFNCGVSRKEIGCFEITDGHWIWPSGLSHYIEFHDIPLPESFVDNILNESRIADDEIDKIIDSHIDIEFWIQWCHQKIKKTIPQEVRNHLNRIRKGINPYL
jgi:hypothetical protein